MSTARNDNSKNGGRTTKQQKPGKNTKTLHSFLNCMLTGAVYLLQFRYQICSGCSCSGRCQAVHQWKSSEGLASRRATCFLFTEVKLEERMWKSKKQPLNCSLLHSFHGGHWLQAAWQAFSCSSERQLLQSNPSERRSLDHLWNFSSMGRGEPNSHE